MMRTACILRREKGIEGQVLLLKMQFLSNAAHSIEKAHQGCHGALIFSECSNPFHRSELYSRLRWTCKNAKTPRRTDQFRGYRETHRAHSGRPRRRLRIRVESIRRLRIFPRDTPLQFESS